MIIKDNWLLVIKPLTRNWKTSLSLVLARVLVRVKTIVILSLMASLGHVHTKQVKLKLLSLLTTTPLFALKLILLSQLILLTLLLQLCVKKESCHKLAIRVHLRLFSLVLD